MQALLSSLGTYPEAQALHRSTFASPLFSTHCVHLEIPLQACQRERGNNMSYTETEQSKSGVITYQHTLGHPSEVYISQCIHCRQPHPLSQNRTLFCNWLDILEETQFNKYIEYLSVYFKNKRDFIVFHPK